MGYACPVCGAEQYDDVHLANHLAVTASLDRPDHEEWLAEYAPNWHDDTPDDLADRVVPHAPEIDTPEFETDDGGRPETGFERELAAQTRGPGRGGRTAGSRSVGAGGPRSDEVESVIAEARELTMEMRLESDEDADQDARRHDEEQDRPSGDDGSASTEPDENA